MLLKIIGQCLTNSLLNGTRNLTITEFGLCLALKLWLCNLDRDNSCQAFAEVFTSNLNLSFLQLLRNLWIIVSVCLQCTSQCSTESLQVSTTLDSVDIVNV